MVREITREDPLYNCIVSVETVTGIENEEIMAFGISPEEAKSAAEKILKDSYRCDRSQISELIAEATIEIISTWCSAKKNQD